MRATSTGAVDFPGDPNRTNNAPGLCLVNNILLVEKETGQGR